MILFSDPKKLLSELVAIPSTSGTESQLAACIEAWCQAAGLESERADTSLIVRVGRKSDSRPRLLFNTHIDTVPVGNGWEGDPFDSTWRGGRLTARGANDAKASVAAMLSAAFALQHEPLAGELLVALTTEEETSNRGMACVLERIGQPDGAVTGEPTGLEVVRAQSGLVVLEARWKGSSCHAAHVGRVTFESALASAAKALARLPSHFTLPLEHPLLGTSTMVPTMFQAGERHNVVPDDALVVFDARIAPPMNAEACIEVLQEALPGAEIRVRSRRLEPVETSAEHPLVKDALECLEQAHSIGSSTLSDMALLPGIPAIKCGPGETKRSHTPGEFILERELLAGVRFYTELAPRALASLSNQEITA